MSPDEWRRLMLALLQFQRSPGRFPIALREPRPLFRHIDRVVLLAAGRPVPGLPAAPALEPQLRRAARYFVRTVMLRPGADPHTLLGLQPGFEPAQLREHYRQMIRLTHPDQQAAGEVWPADAAARINLARQLLLSPSPPAAPGLGEWGRPVSLPRPRPSPPTAWPTPQAPRASGWSARIRLAIFGTGAALLAGACLLLGAGSAEHSGAPAPDPAEREGPKP